MASSEDDLRKLLAAPRESLDLELKGWIDPTAPEGIAKIAKGCMALRNNNGGRLVIGFKNDGQPDLDNVPADIPSAFHIDTVQAIVSRYASEPFSVDVQFVEVSGRVHPVISVPAGVRTTVAAKADLSGSDGKALIRDHAVYVRSLRSNDTVSSTEARRGDWDRMIRICFDNREADIGGFVRRHLAALNFDTLAALAPVMATMLNRPSPRERTIDALDRGRGGFEAEALRRALEVPHVGFRESAILLDAEFPPQSATAAFLQRLLRNAPRHTGWDPWLDFSSAKDKSYHPYVLDDGWEALVSFLDPATAVMAYTLDFWRIDPRGTFYHIRALEDDLQRNGKPTPRTQLDFVLQVAATAEIISTGLSFARSLGCDESKASLQFGFRWTGLRGRNLASWAEPTRMFWSPDAAKQDQYASAVTVPLETPPAGIAPHAENAVRGLFALFGGTEFDSRVIEGIVRRTVEQRM